MFMRKCIVTMMKMMVMVKVCRVVVPRYSSQVHKVDDVGSLGYLHAASQDVASVE